MKDAKVKRVARKTQSANMQHRNCPCVLKEKSVGGKEIKVKG